MIAPARVADAWRAVLTRAAAACTRAGRPADAVRVVAVTKGVPVEGMAAAVDAGARDLGENYVQEWQAKRAALAARSITWHFIGRIQRNKVRALVDADLVHSVADPRVGAALAAAAAARGVVLPVLLQVNLAGEASKDGVAPAEVPAALSALRSQAPLAVRGLMTIPPPLAPEEVRPLFRALRALRDAQVDAAALPELSMGMSADFEVAIEEGATLVRVGTAIFGPRPAPRVAHKEAT